MTQNTGRPTHGRPTPQPMQAAPRSPAPQQYAPHTPAQSHAHHTPPPPRPAQPLSNNQYNPSGQSGHNFIEKRLLPRGEPVSRTAQIETPANRLFTKRLSSAFKSRPKAKRNKFLFAAAIGFLIFFVLLAGSTVLSTRTADQIAGLEQSKALIVEKSNSISERIGTAVRWQETALSFRGSPSQIVGISARGNNVSGVALIGPDGISLSHYPSDAKALEAVSVKNIPENGIRIDSFPGVNGRDVPVIIRRAGENFLITQYAPNSFLGTSGAATEAVVSRSGQVIDGTSNVRTGTLADIFAISESQLSRVTTIEQGVGTRALPGGKVMAATRIANTDLTFIRNIGAPAVGINDNLITFLLLFGGTTALIFALMRRAYGQVADAKQGQLSSDLSQLRYQRAVESGRGGIFEINVHENLVFLNRSLARFLGLTEGDQDMSMSHFLSLVATEDRERVIASGRRAIMQGTFEIDIRAAHRPVILKLRGDIRRSGEQSIICGVGSDITEQRGAQSRLQLAEARLYDALNSMTNSFVVWDRLQRILLWNGKFEDFFGFTRGQLKVGQEQHLIEHMAHSHIDDIFKTDDETEPEDVEILLKDGRWVRYVERPTADGGMVSIGTDITETRQREQQLRNNDVALRDTVRVLRKSQARILELADNYEQEKIRAEEASQSKSDFLANMSHELRTPLNAINGFSDIMKKEMFGPLGDPRYKEYISDILFSGQHLLSLINDILDMSKIEAGKMTLNTDMVKVGDMISQVLRIVRGRAEDNKLKLVYENEGEKSVEADPRAVKQILLNLITNAIKFTPEGGTVRVGVIDNQAGVIVKVMDSGIGISKDDINRLAKPFEQVDKDASKQNEGTGLGLALSKSLIELHGGNFLMESQPGEGTTVTFTLPNTPPVKSAPEKNQEVGQEINRLAQDIADVLAGSDNTPNNVAEPVSLSAPQNQTQPTAPPPAA